MPVTPFTVSWDAEAVRRVLDRVRQHPFPPAPQGSGWRYGVEDGFLRDLCAYWTDGFDWQAAVANLNRFPQFTATVDGFPLHFLHVRGEATERRPLLLTHGWPGSHFEFWKVIEPLAFPSRHGGRAEDGFDLVIPSLPGFGFSGRPAAPIDQRRTAELFRQLMTEVLGYPRFLAHGGDWGAMVTGYLGLDHGDAVAAAHMTMLFPQPGAEPDTAEEKEWAAKPPMIEQALGGYRHVQATKPGGLAQAMAGNPVGQAAWIIERFHDWADLRERPFEDVFTRDELLTNVMIYVMTEAFATSTWFYVAAVEKALRKLQPGQRVTTPTAFARFPDPLHPWPPRPFVEKGYTVSRWTDMPRGGHFAALEAPDLLVDDLRDWAAAAWR
ncbi:epoxide hydrolase family protein [Roseomonas sp. BN140053]|uniref:epoxide hydrolase family protein n=1 Tax=Roseomonas sp. BN140053 TaxID=3391898 RepID=UPI0039EAFA41